MGPALNNVPAAFARIAAKPRALNIDRKGITLPKGGHLQGIQRFSATPERLVITSSSDTEAYFLTCTVDAGGTQGRAESPTRLAVRPLHHAGGCQTVGTMMVVGVEDDDSRKTSEVQFWNLAGSPTPLPALTLRRSGPEKVATAGAVGITSFRGGSALAVASWDAETIDFYVSTADPTNNPNAKFAALRTWYKSRANKVGWIDQNFGAYQSVNLVSQRDGQLFLFGFHRDGDDDWMDLYAVDLGAPTPNTLRKIAKKHMYCTNGCTFRHGSGIYVPNSDSVEVYAVNGISGDHVTGATINANHFFPA